MPNSSPDTSLNVIVPCYDLPENWEIGLARHFEGFKSSIAGMVNHVGLLVVLDGWSKQPSESDSWPLEKLVPGAKIIAYKKNQGKGFALRKGVAMSNSTYHLLTDADFPYNQDSMKRMVERLLARGGIVAGNRDQSYYVEMPAFRKRLSKLLRWMIRNIFRQPINDSQCGLKGFDNAGREIFLQTTINRFLFDLEFLMLAGRTKVPVTPVPVELRKGVRFSKVGWKVLFVEFVNLLRLLAKRIFTSP